MVDEDSREQIVILSTLAFTRIDDLLVMCHTSAPPADEDWNKWVQQQAQGRHRGALIASAGGAPNSKQRGRVVEALKGVASRPPVALLSDSPVLRGLITVFTWLLGSEQPVQAFSPTAVSEAVTWLNCRASAQSVEAALQRLRAALGLDNDEPR